MNAQLSAWRRALPGGSYTLTALLSLAVVAQAGFWYLATPGPALAGVPRSFSAAVQAIGWSVLVLALVPFLAARIGRFSLTSLRIAVGDARVGWRVTALAIVVVAPFLVIGAGDAAVQATYPWPGAWLDSVGALLAWAPLYLLYYVSFEFFYRGFLLAVAERAFGIVPAQWLQAFAATLIHAGKPVPELLLALPASLFFGYLVVRTRSLVWPILLHLAIGLITDISVATRLGWW